MKKNITQDPWTEWLLHGRFLPTTRAQTFKQLLYPIRDTILSLAALKEGDIVLDVGCGDGLIAFAALEKIGEHGKVIFNDFSSTLLDHCLENARSRQVLERCQFLNASVEDLSALSAEAVMAVTVRSVLIYVQEKQKAFSEIYRVLQPGGHLAIYEPIPNFDTFGNPAFPDRFYGYEVKPVKNIAQKVQAVFADIEPWETDSTTNFAERDMLAFAEQAGFTTVNATVSLVSRSYKGPLPWEHFLRLQMNPRLPTIEEAMQQALTAQESEQFSLHLRPLVESGQGVHRHASLYMQAIK